VFVRAFRNLTGETCDDKVKMHCTMRPTIQMKNTIKKITTTLKSKKKITIF